MSSRNAASALTGLRALIKQAAAGEPRAHPPTGRRRLVWLASYPKSGNTWMRLLLASALCAEEVSANELGEKLPWARSNNREHFDETVAWPSSHHTDDELDALRPQVYGAWAEQSADRGGLLFCKAHDALHHTALGEPLFPEEATVGAVYLVRNPLDVVVSWAHHSGHPGFSRMIAILNARQYEIPATATHLRERLLDWSGHVESWMSAPFPVLLVRYEDLLANTLGELVRTVRFLRLDAATDERRLRKAVAASDFARLQAREEQEAFQEKPTTAQHFFRSGKAGDWRRCLDRAQVREVANAHGRLMTALGYAAVREA